MSYLTDDLARILARPMPRRQAFRLAGSVLAGAFLASFGVKRAKADPVCNPACGKLEQCCPGGNGVQPFCTLKTRTCCVGSSCGILETCCSTPQDSNGNYCVRNTGCQTLCYGGACVSPSVCCSVAVSGSHCVSSAGECPGSVIS